MKPIEELRGAGVIDLDTASGIKCYCAAKHQAVSGILQHKYQVLGAVLIGLGFILIIGQS